MKPVLAEAQSQASALGGGSAQAFTAALAQVDGLTECLSGDTATATATAKSQVRCTWPNTKSIFRSIKDPIL